MDLLPKVLLVGSDDVDARLDIMHRLKGDFGIGAVGSSPTLGEKFSAEGFHYSFYHLSRRVNPFIDLMSVGQLVSIFRRLRPQIVHAFDTKPGVWGCLAARLAGVPVIIGTITGLGGALYGRDDLKTRLIRSLYQQLQTLACHLSDVTVFQNHDDARQCIADGIVSRSKSKVILGSGVTTESFAPAQISDRQQVQLRHELGIQPGQLVVTMISRVIRSKGVLEFMQAAQAVRPAHPQVRFLLIGPEDNDSLDRLQSAELAQLKQTLIWPGPRRDIPAVLAMSDVFVLPTAYREGIPRVLLEAAASGLPLITTDTPGCNEVVENEVNGFLIPIRDSRALGQALLQLIEQPELRQRFGEISRQRTVEHFDLSVIATQTSVMYRQLLARKALLPAPV